MEWSKFVILTIGVLIHSQCQLIHRIRGEKTLEVFQSHSEFSLQINVPNAVC